MKYTVFMEDFVINKRNFVNILGAHCNYLEVIFS